MDNALDTQKRSFTIRDSIAYAAGEFGCSMSFALKGTMAIFWTQFMGLELWYSLLLIVVQVWDAVNDPIIGSIIDADKRQYKRNKFLNYIWIGSIGLVIGGACCFIPAPNAPLWAQMVIFVAGYVIWDACYTLSNVPYGSLLSLISDKPADRASLSAWRSVASILGNILPVVILPFIIFDAEDNIIGNRVFFAALLMGGLGFLCFRFMLTNTEIRVDAEVTISETEPDFNIIKALSNFVHNRPAVGATVAAMGTFIGMQGATTAVTVMFQSYFHNAKVSGIVQLFAMIPIVLFTPIARKMVVKYGKKELATFGAIFSLVASVCMIILPITPDKRGIYIYVATQLVYCLGVGIFSTVSWAMMGDAIDYNQWKTGKREEGTVYALNSFFRKLAQGLGPALVLALMVALGYVGENGGNQAPEVALNMRYLVSALYTLSAIIELIGLGLIYNLDKTSLDIMNRELGRTEQIEQRSIDGSREDINAMF